MANDVVKAIPLSSLNSTALSSSYQALNSSGLPAACFFIRIVNGGTTAITLSYDGITDNEQVLNGQVFELPSQSNSQPGAFKALMSKGTVVYVKGSAGASGAITLSGYYT